MDPASLVQQADRCLTGLQEHVQDGWLIRAKAMAEYRAGRMEPALEGLLKAETMFHGEDEDAEKVVISFFLGMAYQRLNRAEEAKVKYQQGLRLMEKAFGGLDRYQPGKGDWSGWAWCQLVRREAEAVLSAKDPGKKP